MQQPETNKRPDNTPVELTIEKWVYGGEGLARLEGRVILVPRVIPGEVVRVEMGNGKPGMLRAGLVEVITPSERRVEPPCPYFGRCGGCHYQHADYAFQTEQKVAVLREVLRRIGKIDAPEQIDTVAGEPWNYRNRAQFHLENGQLGYLEAGSHKLCAIDHCPISSPRLNEVIGILREMMQDRRWPRFIKTLEVFTNESDVQVNVLDSERPVARWFFDWCAEQIPGAAAGSLEYKTANDKYRVGHRSFFQVNRFLIDALIETALAEAQGGTALDLYAGVGLFSIPLARRFEKVVAVESECECCERSAV